MAGISFTLLCWLFLVGWMLVWHSMVELGNKCICLVSRGFLVTYSCKAVDNFTLLILFCPSRAFCWVIVLALLTMKKVAAISRTRLSAFIWLGVVGKAGWSILIMLIVRCKLLEYLDNCVVWSVLVELSQMLRHV